MGSNRGIKNDPLVTIGAHTLNHRPLNSLDRYQIYEEVVESKTLLETKLGEAIDHFSYPFGTRGEVSHRVFEVVKQCHFKTAVTTRSANIFPKHKNHLECLPRVELFAQNNIDDLSLFISGAKFFYKNKWKRVVTI